MLGIAHGGSETVGAASLTIARMIGMMVGLSALTTWGLAEFTRRVARHPLPLPTPGQSSQAYQAAVTSAALFVFDRLFLIAAVLCGVAALVSLVLRRTPEPA